MLLGQRWDCASNVGRERSPRKNLDCRESTEGMPTFWQMALELKRQGMGAS